MFSNSLVVDDELADECYNLGRLYKNKGKLVEAEQMFQQALQGYKKAWGLEHTSTLNVVNNLGRLYVHQDKPVKAEQMFQRALQGYKKAWGPEHTSTLIIVNNLGLLYADQGKLVEAKQMYQRALQGYEKVVGPDHPRSQSLRNRLDNLNAIIGDKSLVVIKESERPLHLYGKKTPSKSKRFKLFRKLDL
jgi:tetratricopeptide (TPR) repeat protein